MSEMMKAFVMHAVGQGPVGMMATVGARLRGAGLVIGVESMPNRIALAEKYGCDVIVDFTKEDPIEAILKATGGKGVDSAIEALGSSKTFAACMSRLLRLIESNRVDPLALTTHRFAFKDIEKAFKMMQTKEDGMIKPLISFG